MPTPGLRALLQPRSIAVVGASPRPDSIGNTVLRQLAHGRFAGAVTAVNPRHEQVEGVPCVASLEDLPAAVEHVALAVADNRVESLLEQAIAAGARAATVYGSLLDDDGGHTRRERVQALCRRHGIALCGGMSMGFYDFSHDVWLGGFVTRADHRKGGISLVSQSGSVLAALLDCDQRLDFNLAVSSGLELVVSMEDYLEHALARVETRVIGLFIETVRAPRRFAAALQAALARAVPVVVLKVGRGQRAARAVASHSGALTGSDRAFQAVLEHHGAVRVDSLDQMAASLLLFDKVGELPPGGLVTVHDSGGERGLLLDLAEQAGVPFATLAPATLARVAARLDGDLPAENPLDAWSSGHDWVDTMQACLGDMMADPEAAIGALVCDRSPDGDVWPEYHGILATARAASGRAVCLVSNHQGTGPSTRVVELAHGGIPALDGAPVFLAGVRHLMDWRDARQRARREAPSPPTVTAPQAWRERLGRGETLHEDEALRLLSHAGIASVERRRAASLAEVLAAGAELGFPLVLKTAAALAHKSDSGGVRLDITDDEALAAAYTTMAGQHGGAVLVQRMAPRGVEILLGAVDDADFGVLVTLAAGGVFAEWLDDAVTLPAPFPAETARAALSRLKVSALLAGTRGAPAADIDALGDAAARFSALAAALAGSFSAIDVNPVIVHAQGCVAVDALALGASQSRAAVATGDDATQSEVQTC